MKLLPIDTVHVDELLDRTLQNGCHELQLRVGQSPHIRACRGTAEDGLLPYEALDPLDLMQMVYAVLTDDQILQFERAGSLSLSYSTCRHADFNVNLRRVQAVLEADFAAVL